MDDARIDRCRPPHETVLPAASRIRRGIKKHRIELCEEPVFVVGAPRSGTSGFARALGRHSHLWAAEETFILDDLFGNGKLEGDFRRWADRPSASWFRSQRVDLNEFLSCVGLGLNALFTSRSAGRRWVDHTPHYVFIVDTLAVVFPGAKFVHLLRDGRSVVRSMLHVAEAFDVAEREEMHERNYLPGWSRGPGVASKTWSDSVVAGIRATKNYPERCITVRYEDAVNNTEATFRTVLDFLGVEYENGPVEEYHSGTEFSSFPSLDPIERAKSSAEAAWSSFDRECREAFLYFAGDVMVEYGLASRDDLHIVPA